MPTVLAVAQTRRPGGAEVILTRTMGRLARRGWRVVLATPGPGPTRALARAAGVDTAATPVAVGAMRRGDPVALAGVAALAALALARRADAIYLDGRVTGRLAPAAALARVPAVLHVHDLLGPGDESRLWRRSWYWSTVRRVLVDSQAVGRTVTALGVDPMLVRNARVAVELDPPPPARTPEWATGEGEVVGYVGRIEPRKGTLDLLAAAPAILERRPGARIVIVGDDDFGVDPAYAAETRERAAALGARVVLAGPQPHAERLMRHFDVLAMPSRSEPGGTAAAEALAAGVPVVAAGSGGMDEVVIEGRTGRLVPAGEPAALADAIVAVLADPDRAALAARAREHAKLFSAERSADVVEAALREAIAEHATGRRGRGR